MNRPEATTRKPIYCSCCGTQVMGWREGNRIIISDRRHGERHTAVVTLDKKPQDVVDVETRATK